MLLLNTVTFYTNVLPLSLELSDCACRAETLDPLVYSTLPVLSEQSHSSF